MSRLSVQDLFTVLLIAGSLAASAALFFVLRSREADETMPRPIPTVDTARPGAAAPPRQAHIRDEEDRSGAGAETDLASAVLKDLVRKIAARQSGELLRLLEGAVNDAAQLRRFAQAVERGALALDVTQPLTELREEGASSLEWNVHLLHQPEARPDRLVVTLARGGDHAWILEHAALPDLAEVENTLAGQPAAAVDPQGEALSAARGFLQAMEKRDFARARQLAERSGVPNEKLAALGIVLEEGAFVPAERAPLLATSVTEDRAWVLARVASEAYGMSAEFGLEMAKQEDGSWLIESINFSSLMNEFVRADKTEEPFQEPLVAMPEGGESIALYFAYDAEALSARSLRQLGIVAEILRVSPERKITIAGHTDALGEETYNESLSERRARRVADALRHLGVPSGQIATESFGEAVPLRPNTLPDGSDNPEGRKRNRRTEIYLNF